MKPVTLYVTIEFFLNVCAHKIYHIKRNHNLTNNRSNLILERFSLSIKEHSFNHESNLQSEITYKRYLYINWSHSAWKRHEVHLVKRNEVSLGNV